MGAESSSYCYGCKGHHSAEIAMRDAMSIKKIMAILAGMSFLKLARQVPMHDPSSIKNDSAPKPSVCPS